MARAIQVHQALLQRPKLTRTEHAYILLCLGLDFKRGGFVDRALEAFNEVLRLDPEEPIRPALPAEAARRAASVGRRLPHPPAAGRAERARHAPAQPGDPRVPRERARRSRRMQGGPLSTKRRGGSTSAIDLDPTTTPAYLNLGDVRLKQGDRAAAVAAWERLLAGVARSRLSGVRSAGARARRRPARRRSSRSAAGS